MAKLRFFLFILLLVFSVLVKAAPNVSVIFIGVNFIDLPKIISINCLTFFSFLFKQPHIPNLPCSPPRIVYKGRCVLVDYDHIYGYWVHMKNIALQKYIILLIAANLRYDMCHIFRQLWLIKPQLKITFTPILLLYTIKNIIIRLIRKKFNKNERLFKEKNFFTFSRTNLIDDSLKKTSLFCVNFFLFWLFDPVIHISANNSKNI